MVDAQRGLAASHCQDFPQVWRWRRSVREIVEELDEVLGDRCKSDLNRTVSETETECLTYSPTELSLGHEESFQGSIIEDLSDELEQKMKEIKGRRARHIAIKRATRKACQLFLDPSPPTSRNKITITAGANVRALTEEKEALLKERAAHYRRQSHRSTVRSSERKAHTATAEPLSHLQPDTSILEITSSMHDGVTVCWETEGHPIMTCPHIKRTHCLELGNESKDEPRAFKFLVKMRFRQHLEKARGMSSKCTGGKRVRKFGRRPEAERVARSWIQETEGA